jgi:hypothetical protein
MMRSERLLDSCWAIQPANATRTVLDELATRVSADPSSLYRLL